MPMTWLITGGAGYVGSHVVFETIKSGRDAVVLDDLSTGLKSRLPSDLPFEKVTLTDRKSVFHVFEKHNFTGVLHLAAKKQVGESVIRPDYYWEENVVGLQNLVDAMVEHEVRNFVFSSSAAVYGQPNLDSSALIAESRECKPINPYGETKLEGEHISEKLSINFDFKVAALRYFNVAGSGRPELGDVYAQNLVPIVFKALDLGVQPIVFGNDYETLDGSCVRDYVHVQDLAEAHVAAMAFVEGSEAGFNAINIGTGSGSSVFEVIEMIQDVTGESLDPAIGSRRVGDPAALVADVSHAKEILDWTSSRGLREIVSSAWDAWQLSRK
jgi:UDP-glucose 4-epimerase